MAKKYVTEDNLNDILDGISDKFIQINQNVSRKVTDLISTPITLTNGFVSYDLLDMPTNYEYLEFEFLCTRTDNQIKVFNATISKDELQSLYVSNSADIRNACFSILYNPKMSTTDDNLEHYIGVQLRYVTENPQALLLSYRVGASSTLGTGSSVVVSKIKGINYTQSFGDVPLGTVITYMGLTPPDEYLSCDGTTYNISEYWELAEFFKTQFGSYNKFGGDGTTTFAVPDLRGEFLRGTGANSHVNQGNGATVGSHQDATVTPRFFSRVQDNALLMLGDTANDLQAANMDSSYSRGTGSKHWNVAKNTTNTTQVTNDSFTYRPTNTSILYCIKYTSSLSRQPANEYSTEEKRIGTWIDGKPLYQITFTGTLPASGTLSSVISLQSVSSLGIDRVTSVDSLTVQKPSTGQTAYGGLPGGEYSANSTNNGIYYFIRSDNTLSCLIYSNSRWSDTYYVTIKYTKQ